MTSRACGVCGEVGGSDFFSRRQWRKGVGRSRCRRCAVGDKRGEVPVAVHNDSRYADFSDNALVEPFDEGAFRWVALGHYIDEEGQSGRTCVAKWLKDEWPTSGDAYRGDLRCVRRALQFVRAFNATKLIDVHLKVIVPQLARFPRHSVLPGIVHLREPFLDNYDKWNSNSGWYDATTRFGEAMQALSHFSYHASAGEFVLCDLQGAILDSGDAAVITDPAIISRDMSYGSTDMGIDGIDSFFYEHQCNAYCNDDWRKPDLPMPAFVPVSSTTVWDGATARYIDDDGASREYTPMIDSDESEHTGTSAGTEDEEIEYAGVEDNASEGKQVAESETEAVAESDEYEVASESEYESESESAAESPVQSEAEEVVEDEEPESYDHWWQPEV